MFSKIRNLPNRMLITVWVLLIGIPAVHAQKQWSLKECIEYALDHNIQVKQQLLNLQLSADNLLQSKAALLPSVNANVSHGYNFGKSVDRFTNQFATQQVAFENFYLTGNLTLFNGFQMLNTIARNRLNLRAGQYDVEKMRNDIALNVASVYLTILFNKELLEIAEEQALITSQQVERTSKLLEAGTVSKGNLLSLQAQAASEEVQVVSMQNNLDISVLSLIQLLELSPGELSDIRKPELSVPETISLDIRPPQILNLALETQPQIKSAELKVESAMKDLKIARGSYLPQLMVQGSYGSGYSEASQQLKSISMDGYDTIGFTTGASPVPVVSPTFSSVFEMIPWSDQIDANINKSLGFYLNIPIFNGLQARTANSRAKIGIESARLSYQQEKNLLEKDIQQAYADVSAAIRKYKAAKKSVEAMKENYFYADQKFSLGLLNFVDYSEAKKNLAKAESEMLQAKYEYVFKMTILDFYMGKPIEFK